MRFLGVLATLLAFSGATFSATIYVPDDFSTIQGAIDASSNGDTVIVRPGTYVENINFNGKTITVRSEKGPAVTTIDGGNPSNPDDGSCVYIWNQEAPVLDGFTITNGKGTAWLGGGLGGAVMVANFSSATLRNNIIAGNHPNFCYGGGIYSSAFSNVIIEDTVIFNNGSGNGFEGGGIYCQDSTLTIVNSAIISNKVEQDFYGYGGGICVRDTNTTLTNTVLYMNDAFYGGGIFSVSDPLSLTNCTLCKNNADGGKGGGIYLAACDATVTNSIMSKDASYEVTLTSSSSLTVSYSDIEGGQGKISGVPYGGTLNWGPGMIEDDPLFHDSYNGDLHLTWDSPCRDTGDNPAVTEPTDYEGDPRIALGTVDMGADEYFYHLYHMGDVIPGSPIDIKVVGYPTAPITLYLGSGLADPPYSTQHGDFWLNWPPLWQGNIGTVPGNGVLTISPTVPTTWIPDSEHPLQALVGPWGGPWTRLTNAEVLVVE